VEHPAPTPRPLASYPTAPSTLSGIMTDMPAPSAYPAPPRAPSAFEGLRRAIGSIPLPIFFPVGALIGIVVALVVVGGVHGGGAGGSHRKAAAAGARRAVPVVVGARSLTIGRPPVTPEKIERLGHGKKAALQRAAAKRNAASPGEAL
jgi:hypothetical protein